MAMTEAERAVIDVEAKEDTSSAVDTQVEQPPAIETTPTPTQLPVAVDGRGSMIERAADEAARSVIAGRDEFLSLAQQARILSMSGLAPKQVRGDPYVAFHMALIGRDLELSPTATFELVDIIGEGKDARPSLSPELMIGRVRKLKLGQVKPLLRKLDVCIAIAVSIDWTGVINDRTGEIETSSGHVIGTTEFTWEEAKIANLVDSRCEDALHHAQNCKCRQGWRTYPRRLLWWRAAGFCVDDYFPEASIGLYSPEELGVIVDENGRAIDPARVDLPEGYDKASVARAGDNLSDDELRELDAQLWDLQLHIRALSEERRSELRNAWRQSKLAKLQPHQLSQSLEQYARSLVAGVERSATKDGWDQEQATLDVLAELARCVAVSFPALASVSDAAESAQTDTSAQASAESVSEQASDTSTDDSDKPSCSICGSSRAELLDVRGVTRCRNATDCARRVERAQATQASLDEQQ